MVVHPHLSVHYLINYLKSKPRNKLRGQDMRIYFMRTPTIKIFFPHLQSIFNF